MKFVRVLIPFHRSETDMDCEVGEILEMSEEELMRIRKVNVNMVEEVEEKPKRKRAKKQ